MMIEHITPERIANSILQKRKTEKYFIIVEGKLDEIFFNKFIDRYNCEVEIAFGNQNVVDVIAELNNRNFNSHLGIIDSDFKILDKQDFQDVDILLNDFHDLEVLLINSNAFEIIMGTYNTSKKIESIYKNYNKFREHLFNLSKHIGYLKWLNNSDNLGLIFKPLKPDGKYLDYSKFISKKDLKFLGYKEMVDTVLGYCNGKVTVNIKREEIISKIESIDKDVDLNHLCNGHDLMQIIALSLKKHIGNFDSNAIPAQQLEKEFVLAFDSMFFVATSLYKQIKDREISKQIKILNC